MDTTRNIALAQAMLQAPCSKHFAFRDFVQCGETWEMCSDEVPNLPLRHETWRGIRGLACEVLDSVIDQFGALQLTYAFSSPALSKRIPSRICPSLDQHAGYEVHSGTGRTICGRGGQAVDIGVPCLASGVLVKWLFHNTPFDRIYFYGSARPVHVSWSPNPSRQVVWLHPSPSGRRVPKLLTPKIFDKALSADAAEPFGLEGGPSPTYAISSQGQNRTLGERSQTNRASVASCGCMDW